MPRKIRFITGPAVKKTRKAMSSAFAALSALISAMKIAASATDKARRDREFAVAVGCLCNRIGRLRSLFSWIKFLKARGEAKS